jgi:hypothetical protein
LNINYFGQQLADRPEHQQSVSVPTKIPANINQVGAMRAYKKFHGALDHRVRVDAAKEFAKAIGESDLRIVYDILHSDEAKRFADF